jgi:hypothetical protein
MIEYRLMDDLNTLTEKKRQPHYFIINVIIITRLNLQQEATW